MLTITTEPTRARTQRAHARASLSVVCMTAGPGPRIAAILDLLRPIANEIVVAVDDRADEAVFADVAAVADRVIEYPFAQPVDRPLPWLFHECRSDWMLTIDDDEVPSVALLELLPSLCADERVVHYSIARRWVYPDATTYLDDAPWRPDYQLRLFRTDARLIRFSDALHRPIIPKGPGAFVREPLWHLDTVVRTAAQRLAKAHDYEVQRPGLRAHGRALNYSFYLPEARPSAPLAALPDADRTLVAAVLDARRPNGGTVATRERVERSTIDAFWPSRRGRQEGEIAFIDEVRTMTAGEQHAVDVLAFNTGEAVWEWGRDAEPAVRCASWWDDDDREDAIWTPLPRAVEPGSSVVVPVHVRTPSAPGRHILHIDLVHEDVRWFGRDVTHTVEIRARRRTAFLGVGDDEIRDVLAADPDVEPIILRREPRTDCEGYVERATAWHYLAGGRRPLRARFAARALRLLTAACLRRGVPPAAREFFDVLDACDRLVVRSEPRPLRREAWCDAVVVRAARLYGLAVELR